LSYSFYFVRKVGESMKLRDHLTDDQIKKLKAKTNYLSRKDILELMGVNRDTYKRVKGRLRRK